MIFYTIIRGNTFELYSNKILYLFRSIKCFSHIVGVSWAMAFYLKADAIYQGLFLFTMFYSKGNESMSWKA